MSLLPPPSRRTLLWLALATTPVILQLAAHVLVDLDPGNLLVDPAELSDEVTGWDGALTTLGIAGWVTATAISWFTLSLVGADAALRPALFWVGALSAVLGFDDRFLLHEKASRVGLDEKLVLAAYGLFALWVVGRHLVLLTPHVWLLGAAAIGFGVSIGIDVIVEDLLELYVSGERFIEENAKLFGILAWAAFATDLARRALRDAGLPVEPAAV